MADYATLLRDRVTLTVRCVDRIFLQGYVPKLQSVGWVCQFLNWQRGYAIPSSAAFGKRSTPPISISGAPTGTWRSVISRRVRTRR